MLAHSSIAVAPIAVATSIPPALARISDGKAVGPDYQHLCIRSMIECGFRVISVNDADEIAQLAPRFPEVRFVATDRNASVWTGRKNPYIADLLLALKGAPEPVVGIVNSDIVFEPSLAWRSALPRLTRENIVVGHRCETTSLSKGSFQRYLPGFDWFFFDKPLAAAVIGDAMPYAMGLPMWDYWLPIAAAAHGRRVLIADRPTGVHLSHASGFPDASLSELARHLMHYIVKAHRSSPQAFSKGLADLAAVAGEASGNDDIFGEKIADVVREFRMHIRDNVVRLESGVSRPAYAQMEPFVSPSSDEMPSLSNLFRGFEARLKAGEALNRSAFLLQQKKDGEAFAELSAALDAMPQNFHVLLACGEFQLRQRRPENAAGLLRKALAQDPSSPQAFTALGAALRAAKKAAEAVECFEKALLHAPEDESCYANLAVALCDTGRSREAAALLEKALARRPDFAQVAALYLSIARGAATANPLPP